MRAQTVEFLKVWQDGAPSFAHHIVDLKQTRSPYTARCSKCDHTGELCNLMRSRCSKDGPGSEKRVLADYMRQVRAVVNDKWKTARRLRINAWARAAVPPRLGSMNAYGSEGPDAVDDGQSD